VAPSPTGAHVLVTAALQHDVNADDRTRPYQLALEVRSGESTEELAQFLFKPSRGQADLARSEQAHLARSEQAHLLAALKAAAQSQGQPAELSPAGRILVAIAQEGKSPGILYAIDLPEGKVGLLAEFHPRCNLALSPDGRRLAFLDASEKVTVLDARMLLRVGGATAPSVTFHTAQPDFLAWSPGGDAIASVRGGDLLLLDKCGSTIRLLAAAHSAAYRNAGVQRTGIATPVWSSDGKTVHYADFTAPQSIQFPPGATRDGVFRVDALGSNPQLVGGGGRLRSLPYAGHLFVQELFGEWRLMKEGKTLAAADKALLERLPAGLPKRPAAWSRDGKHVVYADGEKIELLDLATGNKHIVRRLRPGGLAFAPDGSAVAIQRWRPAEKLVRISALSLDGSAARLLATIPRPDGVYSVVLFDWVK
jgi:hypothetical protein